MAIFLLVLFGFFASGSTESCSPTIDQTNSWFPLGSSASFFISCTHCTTALRAAVLVDSIDLTSSNSAKPSDIASRYIISVPSQPTASIFNATAVRLTISSITYTDAPRRFLSQCNGYNDVSIGATLWSFSVYSGALLFSSPCHLRLFTDFS